MHSPLLDPDFHTPSLVCSRSPFLLTTSAFPTYSHHHECGGSTDQVSIVRPQIDNCTHNPTNSARFFRLCFSLPNPVCAIASKFYDARPELHSRLTNLARKLAFTVPEKGYKSVEIVQAYLLNTLWGCGPVERYENDRTWMLLGMAIRFVPSAPFPGQRTLSAASNDATTRLTNARRLT